MSPCKNRRNPGLHPKASAAYLKPKYQFSLRGNIKDRRDLRGVSILRPPPYGLRGLAERVLVGHGDLELLVDIYRVGSNDFIDCLLNFIGIFVVREL